MKNCENGNQTKHVIAVCGKGGVGKTAFTAMLTQALMTNEKAGKLIVIDADPAIGLPNTLGIKAERTMGQVRETIIDTAKHGDADDKTKLANLLDYLVLDTLVETDQLAFLAMGRSETQGCYCSVNTLLRCSIELLMQTFDTILIDEEAGLEQINRQVVSEVDDLIILTDTSSRGRETVAHIRKMVTEDGVINCRKLWVVINRVPDGFDETVLIQSIQEMNVPVLGIISLDENIVSYDAVGKPLTELPSDSQAVLGVKAISEKLLNQD